jgi:glycine oxidase
MTKTATTSQHANATSPDLLIVGGGIVGLWCAERAARIGLKTILVEKGKIGQGGSGGFLGALMPHQPVSWTDEKQYQFEALLALEKEVATLQETTGIDCGYLRCGRLIPTQTEKKQAERKEWHEAAKKNWLVETPTAHQLSWNISDAPLNTNWLNAELQTLGCEHETLTARIATRKLIQALRAAVQGKVEIREHTEVNSLSNGESVTLSDGTTLSPGKTIVAAGWGSFPLVEPISLKSLGRGVKGQAALFKPKHQIDPTLPIIYFGGLYVIAHENGLIAVGSTSENAFASPSQTDHQLEDLIARAAKICPALEGAEVIERWAGVRPNAVGRHPMIGPLPQAPNVIMATGGFKISFGIAHKMASDALTFATSAKPQMPEMFELDYHFARAK